MPEIATRKTKWPATECDLCAAAIEIYQRSYDVHSEVLPRLYEITPTETAEGVSPIDIVLVKHGGELMAVEAKLTFGAEVIAQAWARRDFAHFIGVLTPMPSAKVIESNACKLLRQTCHQRGIGVSWLAIDPDTGAVQLDHRIKPRRRPPIKGDPSGPQPQPPRLAALEDALCEATRRFNVAGAKTGNENNLGKQRYGGGDRQWDAVRRAVLMARSTERDGSWSVLKDIAHDLRLRGPDRNALNKAARRGAIGGLVFREMHGQMHVQLTIAGEESARAMMEAR